MFSCHRLVTVQLFLSILIFVPSLERHITRWKCLCGLNELFLCDSPWRQIESSIFPSEPGWASHVLKHNLIPIILSPTQSESNSEHAIIWSKNMKGSSIRALLLFLCLSFQIASDTFVQRSSVRLTFKIVSSLCLQVKSYMEICSFPLRCEVLSVSRSLNIAWECEKIGGSLRVIMQYKCYTTRRCKL